VTELAVYEHVEVGWGNSVPFREWPDKGRFCKAELSAAV